MGAAAKRVAAQETASSGKQLTWMGKPVTPEEYDARVAENNRQAAWAQQSSSGPTINGMKQILGGGSAAPATFQAGGGAASAGGARGTTTALGNPSTAVNTAAPDPLLQSAIQTFQDRAKADNTKRATNRVFGASRTAAAGLNNDLDAQMARRGIGGSGLDARARTQVSEAAARAAAGGAANIQMGQQNRLDQLAQAGAGIAAMPANLALQQQGLGIQQMSLQNAAQNQQAQLAMQQQAQQQAQQQQQMQNWLQLMQIL